jgi:hypothetical protein
MKRILAVIFAIPIMILGEAFAGVLFMVLLFGGILAIGVLVGHYVSYVFATVLAIAWAILILRFRDRLDAWFG